MNGTEISLKLEGKGLPEICYNKSVSVRLSIVQHNVDISFWLLNRSIILF